jgi:hypothetical protein
MKRPIVTVVALLIGVVVLLLMKKRISSLLQAMKNRRSQKKEQALLNDLGLSASYSANWYQNLANELKQSVLWSVWLPNCDETGTQKALKKLNNDRDYIELALAFGITDGWSMEQWIHSCLNPSEKNFINQNWSDKGMTTKI